MGTGVYGQSNKNTLTFNFKPNIIFVSNTDIFASLHSVSWLHGMAKGDNGYNGRMVELEWGERKISWYSLTTGVNGPERLQLNGDGVTYYYVALG